VIAAAALVVALLAVGAAAVLALRLRAVADDAARLRRVLDSSHSGTDMQSEHFAQLYGELDHMRRVLERHREALGRQGVTVDEDDAA
jgi:hypothetical protein